MKWVTWENIGIDRMACAWLIRKQIDPEAKFLFIPRGTPLPVDAEPFDIPGVPLSHHGGHCSFHALLRKYKLKDPILDRIARIVDEADTIQEVSLEPAAAGLDLICEGLVYEHAFYVDYQNRKADYVDKFINHIDWSEVDTRYRASP